MPKGESYFHAEATGWPVCAGGVSFYISASGICAGPCISAGGIHTGSNNGCNGCMLNIEAGWDDCQGVLSITDFKIKRSIYLSKAW